MRRAQALDQLAAGLAGAPPRACDWAAVLDLANRSLVTPALAAALEPRASDLPADVAEFLTEVRALNCERNRRLWTQLNEATAALNAAGIEPTLLKGAALWATVAPGGGAFDRILSDLDLLVAPSEVERALAALQAVSFPVARRYPGAAVHVVAELGRPAQDVGFIDLHQRPPGPPALAEFAGGKARRGTLQIEGGRVQVPDAAAQVLGLALHDAFHDGGYWRGGFDLRHLLDLMVLLARLTAGDRAWLEAACGPRLVARAFGALELAAQRIAGGPPADVGRGARLTYARWRTQYAVGWLRLPLAGLALALEWPDLQALRAALDETTPFSPRARIARVRQVLTVETGKI